MLHTLIPCVALYFILLIVFDACPCIFYLMYCDVCYNELMYEQIRHDIGLSIRYHSSASTIFLMYSSPYFTYSYFGCYYMLSVHVMSIARNFLLGCCMHPFIFSSLSVGYTYSSVFLSYDVKRVVSARFLFKSCRLIYLGITQLDLSIIVLI